MGVEATHRAGGVADQHDVGVGQGPSECLDEVEVDDVVVETAEEAEPRVRDGPEVGRHLGLGHAGEVVDVHAVVEEERLTAHPVPLGVAQGAAHVEHRVGLAEQRLLQRSDEVAIGLGEARVKIRPVVEEATTRQGRDHVVRGRDGDHVHGRSHAESQGDQPDLQAHDGRRDPPRPRAAVERQRHGGHHREVGQRRLGLANELRHALGLAPDPSPRLGAPAGERHAHRDAVDEQHPTGLGDVRHQLHVRMRTVVVPPVLR